MFVINILDVGIFPCVTMMGPQESPSVVHCHD